MSEAPKKEQIIDIKASVKAIIESIDQEREREIIKRRFGLYERKETLEQIGELLGITRERVRQLEKAILIRIKMVAERGELPDVTSCEKVIIRTLSDMGRVAKLHELTDKLLGKKSNSRERAHIAFIAELSPNLTVINETDNYENGVAIAEYGDEKKIKKQIEEIIKTIKTNKKPLTIEELHEKLNYEHPNHVQALAQISKHLAHLKDVWGLAKWPTVNPKNIRDKIFVILENKKQPMHFSEIAEEIQKSDFSRKAVTTQAIHNELIKDKRFVLIGRGIYALDTWGFKRGTVADIITSVLQEAGEPLYRDEIVKRVLEKRKVKETTVLLNLQSKKEFKRIAKATYTLAELA